jgi:hypothetical protein
MTRPADQPDEDEPPRYPYRDLFLEPAVEAEELIDAEAEES